MRRQNPLLLVGDSREAFLRRTIANEGLTLKDFANKAGIPTTTLGTILKRGFGTTSIDIAIKICDALNMSLDTIARYPNSDVPNNANNFASMVPPWIKYPIVPASSIEWQRNEELDAYLQTFKTWWSSLNEEERDTYCEIYPSPKGWSDFSPEDNSSTGAVGSRHATSSH